MSVDVRWATKPFSGYGINSPIREDEELTHVGPETPCGEYMRRFWQPVAMSSQLDNHPTPIRILGEELVVFRDRSGDIGLLHKHCAHRGASLEFARLEEHGLRCCYHGWHFDIDGTILETPGEPEDSKIRHKVCQGAYPVREVKRLIFAYFGPPNEIPEFPHYDSIDLPNHELLPYSIHSPSNWLQESENSMDPHHSVFLHARHAGTQFAGLEHFAELPVVAYHNRSEGFVYSHARRINDLIMMRFHDHLTPNMAQNGAMFQNLAKPKAFGRMALTKWVVPIDDTNSRKFGWRHFNDKDEGLRQGTREDVGWEKVDIYGQTAHRSHEERRSNPGDWEAWSSQRPITVHQREYLGTTDEGVSMLRSKLKRDIRAVAKGKQIKRPEGTPEDPIRTYAGDTILRIPKDNQDDTTLIDRVQREVYEIYKSGDKYVAGDRSEFIQREIEARFPSS